MKARLIIPCLSLVELLQPNVVYTLHTDQHALISYLDAKDTSRTRQAFHKSMSFPCIFVVITCS